MTFNKDEAAEALMPMLSVFHLVGDQALEAVWQVYEEGCLDRIILRFGHVSVLIVADENDDSINVTLAGAADLQDGRLIDESRLTPWDSIVGKPFGWGWLTMNQQGYCDGVLLSFDGIEPQIMLNVIASSIHIGKIIVST